MEIKQILQPKYFLIGFGVLFLMGGTYNFVDAEDAAETAYPDTSTDRDVFYEQTFGAFSIGLASLSLVTVIFVKGRELSILAMASSGSMLVVFLIYRLISTQQSEIGFITTGFGVPALLFGAVLDCIVPWSMAIIGSWQGWNALEGRRFKPAFKAMLLHSMLLVTIAFGMTWAPALLALPAAIIWGQSTADKVWLPSGLSPRMKQEWTRLQRTGVSTGVRSIGHEDEAE